MSAPDPPQKVLFAFSVPGTSFFGQVVLDASLSETHTANAMVSQHPTETGPDVTDHIRPLPATLTINGVITNSPIDVPSTQAGGVTGGVRDVTTVVSGKQVTYRAFQFDGQFDRVREAFGVIVDAIQAAALFDVTTTLKSYQNLAVTSFSVPRDSERGNSLEFTIEFQEIIIVSTQTVEALPSSIQRQHRGSKTGKQLDPKTDAQKISIIEQGVQFALKVFK